MSPGRPSQGGGRRREDRHDQGRAGRCDQGIYGLLPQGVRADRRGGRGRTHQDLRPGSHSPVCADDQRDSQQRALWKHRDLSQDQEHGAAFEPAPVGPVDSVGPRPHSEVGCIVFAGKGLRDAVRGRKRRFRLTFARKLLGCTESEAPQLFSGASIFVPGATGCSPLSRGEGSMSRNCAGL
jgi:hypothetical protein